MSSSASSPTLSPHSHRDEHKDVDKEQLDHLLDQQGLHRDDEDENVICWNDDSEDLPLNWSLWPKVYNNAVVYWLEFYMTAISTAATAAATSAYPEYGISMTLSFFAFSSTYLIGQSIGGLIVSPLSESMGSRTLYITSNAVFCVMALLTGTIHSIIPVYISRFLAGFAAAIPATVAFGSFEDQHSFERRIWVSFFYNMIGNSGLALGPVYAAYIIDTIGWRYIYHIAAVAAGVSTVLSAFMMESRSSRILEDKINKIKKETGNDKLQPAGAGEKLTIKKFLLKDLTRPVLYLVTEPIVALCATLLSISYALIYGLTESLTIVYALPGFEWPMANTSLAFLALALGIWIDILPRFYDARLFKKLQAAGTQITAEHKIRSFAVACPTLAIGLWLFAWTVPPRIIGVHWVVSFIGITLIGFSANDFSYVLFGYVTDVYGSNAASAVGALSFARTLVASAFPLFTTQMYEGLGANIATTVFAAVATLFAFTPWLFLGYAQFLKRMSKNAKQDDDGEEEEGDEEEGEQKNGGPHN